ncbi:hypothetical protein Acr_20g0002860 [Actinidia rufa]|uniref:Uncharacterized protein n=1 Tax=Actinidia rufa TaxID=165716 RepID=A0A7J0GCQ4_9ERIC|nr:hypothetical protein Acr_20g0002860 [Actinidia rufa]
MVNAYSTATSGVARAASGQLGAASGQQGAERDCKRKLGATWAASGHQGLKYPNNISSNGRAAAAGGGSGGG